MTFSSELKNELARLPVDSDLEIYEMMSFVRMSGEVYFSEGKPCEIVFFTPLSAIARRLTTFLRHIVKDAVEVSAKKSCALKKANVYRVSIVGEKETRFLLEKTQFGDFPFSYRIPKMKDTDQVRAYLRAAFLAQGSVVSPEKGYHLEITGDSEEHFIGLVGLFEKFSITAKLTERRGKTVLYIKDSQLISDSLNVFGAVLNLFRYEDIRTLKDFKNSINRKVNCDSVNADKIIKTSIRQRQAIGVLEKSGVLNELSPSLREAASLRVEFPERSIAELAALSNPPSAKQTMARRLKKLEKLYCENQKNIYQGEENFET